MHRSRASGIAELSRCDRFCAHMATKGLARPFLPPAPAHTTKSKKKDDHLAHKYDALTMVDDAHGEGVLGRGGRGVVNHFGLEGEVDIEIGRTAFFHVSFLLFCRQMGRGSSRGWAFK